MADVIQPAIRQVDVHIRQRGFSRAKITASDFQAVPRLFLDKNYFQQIIFNLLDNAIKYASSRPDEFRVEIRGGQERQQFYLVIFRDWGPGIQQGWEKEIFVEGVRGPDAVDADVQGHGLGLWIVQRLVRAHGGQISLTRNAGPTEFTIKLPMILATRPPAPKDTP